ncbi:hypothetical protein [Aeromicrobium piscarium]|uniref:Uncharacterized protein n=1 Tax=Aeromicrobium piscarium TaxID=2590901 RepID=A0A554SCW8_9ACTN|nr:hypothetical protein [Aeromicrobium piscarium]TSD64197.1 hypothetical protein FNM00_06495 [Aeromicrobium piscarium]
MAGLIITPEHDDHGREQELGDFLRTLGAPVFEVAAGGGDVPFAPAPRLVRPLVSASSERLLTEWPAIPMRHVRVRSPGRPLSHGSLFDVPVGVCGSRC